MTRPPSRSSAPQSEAGRGGILALWSVGIRARERTTTKLYDRRSDKLTLDEVEKIML